MFTRRLILSFMFLINAAYAVPAQEQCAAVRGITQQVYNRCAASHAWFRERDVSRVECGESDWNRAKTGIDWVLFNDSGALQSYKSHRKTDVACLVNSGMTEDNVERQSSASVTFNAIMFAQKHNSLGQCHIAYCLANFHGVVGYHKKLKDENRIPK